MARSPLFQFSPLSYQINMPVPDEQIVALVSIGIARLFERPVYIRSSLLRRIATRHVSSHFTAWILTSNEHKSADVTYDSRIFD